MSRLRLPIDESLSSLPTDVGTQEAILDRALGWALGPAAPPRRYARTTKRTRTRRGLMWLGQTCNLRCHFCYFLDRIENGRHPEHAFMTLDKAKAICRTLVEDYGNNAIDIQGGEPTLFPGIVELVAYCRRIGLHPTLITNAQVLAQRDRVEALRDAGLRDFLVSVQGLGEAHDITVGRCGAHEKQMLALRKMRELGVPFRFNVVMSRPAVPQLPWIAELAVKSGAHVVNFLAFNPYDDQRSGKRSARSVPRYTDVVDPLAAALDRLAAGDVEANVRYLPLCFAAPEHRPSMYNFQQLSYDHHENDFASWRWTQLREQRTRGDTLTRPPQLGVKLPGRRLARVGQRLLRRAPASTTDPGVPSGEGRMGDAFVAVENALAGIRRIVAGPAAEVTIYREDARRRAFDDLGYRLAPVCASCDLRKVCDGFHADYAEFFGTDEARPVQLGGVIDDPLHFVRQQLKIVQDEDRHWGLPCR